MFSRTRENSSDKSVIQLKKAMTAAMKWDILCHTRPAILELGTERVEDNMKAIISRFDTAVVPYKEVLPIRAMFATFRSNETM